MSHRRKKVDLKPASSPLGKEQIAKAINEMRERGELPDSRLATDNDEEVRHQIKMLRVNAIAWGIPFDEIVFAKWAKNMLGHVRIMPWDDTIFSGSTYLPEARNKIHNRFLEESHCEFLLMLDSDVIAPPGFDQKLMAHMQSRQDVRMVGGWYRLKGEPYQPVVYHLEGHDERGIMQYHPYGENEVGKGLEEVEAAGAGCWLMHKSVAKALGPSPYDMNRGGEDLLLCEKVRAAGFKLWIDWTIACAHAGVAVA